MNFTSKIYDTSELSNALKVKKETLGDPEKLKEILGDGPAEQKIRIQVKTMLRYFQKLLRTKELMESRGFPYKDQTGRINRRISSAGFTLGAKQQEQLKILPGLIEELYTNIQKKEGLESIPLFTRIDAILGTDGDLKIAELEPIYAGIGEALGMRDVSDTVRGTDAFFEGLLGPYQDALDRFGDDTSIVIMPNPKLPGYYPESAYLFSRLQETQKRENFSYFELTENTTELKIEDDGLYLNGEKIDVLLNYFVPKKDSNPDPQEEKILQLYTQGKIQIFPIPTKAFGSKDMLCDDSIIPDALKQFIPKTGVLDANTTLKENMFLKRTVSSLEKRDFFDLEKQSVDIGELLSDEVSWIYQEKVPTKAFPIVTMGRKNDIKQSNMYARVEIYIFFGTRGPKLGDVLVTMGPKPIVKGSREGTMIPAIS